MGARWYDPVIGRFISADTIVPEPNNPQALNRYAYVYNNPIQYTDPTGHEACYDTGVEIGSGISQADCWAYGRDKWMIGLPVTAPVAGAGYSTERGLMSMLREISQIGGGGGVFNPDLLNTFRSRNSSFAITWVAERYGIHLPPGHSWKYVPEFRTLIQTVVGWNPRYPGETLDDFYVVGQNISDNSVVVTFDAFEYFNFDPAGVILIMLHEARHAWVEYYVESAGMTAGSDDIHELDAEYVARLASAFGIELSGAAKTDSDVYYKDLCSNVSSATCSDPTSALEVQYGIELPWDAMFGK